MAPNGSMEFRRRVARMKPIRIEDVAQHPSFRRLEAIAGIVFDLRYAGSNNFDGRVLYRGIDCAWLRVEAARGLESAAAWLAAHHPGQRLLVLDALRPQRVQEAIWRDVARHARRSATSPTRRAARSTATAWRST